MQDQRKFQLTVAGLMLATAVGFWPTGAHASDYTGPAPTVTAPPTTLPRVVDALAHTGTPVYAQAALGIMFLALGLLVVAAVRALNDK